MPGYQFIHLETYGFVVSKTANARKKKQGEQPTRRLNIREVLDEARRVRDACPHVPFPEKPIELYAPIPLAKLEAEIARRKDASVDPLGRKVRNDALCLMAGVVSFSERWADLAGKQDEERVYEFFEGVVDFLKQTFGKALVNVTIHRDEEFPHCHFYCVPQAGKGTFNLIGLHPGITARERAGTAKKGGSREERKARELAYQVAMRRFQDSFHVEVGARFGMARIGPKRKRLTRGEWQAAQRTNDLMAEGVRRLEEELMAAQERVQELESMTRPQPPQTVE